MTVCKNCRHDNLAGALFCSECGSQLEGARITTQAVSSDQLPEIFANATAVAAPPSATTESWLTLFLMESGKVIPVSNRNEITIGRLSQDQPIEPDVDLMPFDAFTAGVSRLHAVIRRDSKRVIVMDLGSSNGTYLNGRRLNPHVEEGLKHGDVVSFGKLKIQILLRIF